jgi:hypothetical protein
MPSGEEIAMTANPVEGARTFEADIKPLFRERDRSSMLFAFDLWSYEDVSQHSQRIIARLRSGTMPCDGPWLQEQIDAFQDWIDAGMAR